MKSHETTVRVWGKEYKISVCTYDEGKTWRAEGKYEGKFLEGRWAKTIKQAVKNWEQLATMHGDF